MVLLRQKFVINEMTDFDIVNFAFLGGNVPRPTSYGRVGRKTLRN